MPIEVNFSDGTLGTAFPTIVFLGVYMKVTVKKKDNSIPVAITTEFIKLQDAMKFANVVYSGGEAKQLILDEQVTVNGEICTMRGRKIRPGDVVGFNGGEYTVSYAD